MLANSILPECIALRGPARPVNAVTEPSSDGCKGEARDVPEGAADAGEGWLSTRPSLSEEDLTATGLG